MKNLFALLLTTFIFTSCNKLNDFHFASVGKVTITAYNDCGLILCINTDEIDGTDICTHPLNLDSSFEFGDTLLIQYKLTGDTFECEVLGFPYFGNPKKKYPVVEIVDYK